MSRARDTADQINRVNSSAADATAITIDSNNNVGIGTAPSATYSAFSTIEFTTASITSQNTATGGASPDGNLILGSNMNYSSGGGPEYKVTGKATQITQIDGNITLGVATSGTANTSITYNTGLEVLNDGYARAKNGLLFGTDTAAANALNDYEEGTWTPSLGGNASYNFQSGFYTKVGNIVHVAFRITLSGGTTNANGLRLDGLPFTVGATTNVGTNLSGWFSAASSNAENVFLGLEANDVHPLFYYQNANGTSTFLGTDAGTGFSMTFSGTYQT